MSTTFVNVQTSAETFSEPLPFQHFLGDYAAMSSASPRPGPDSATTPALCDQACRADASCEVWKFTTDVYEKISKFTPNIPVIFKFQFYNDELYINDTNGIIKYDKSFSKQTTVLELPIKEFVIKNDFLYFVTIDYAAIYSINLNIQPYNSSLIAGHFYLSGYRDQNGSGSLFVKPRNLFINDNNLFLLTDDIISNENYYNIRKINLSPEYNVSTVFNVLANTVTDNDHSCFIADNDYIYFLKFKGILEGSEIVSFNLNTSTYTTLCLIEGIVRHNLFNYSLYMTNSNDSIYVTKYEIDKQIITIYEYSKIDKKLKIIHFSFYNDRKTTTKYKCLFYKNFFYIYDNDISTLVKIKQLSLFPDYKFYNEKILYNNVCGCFLKYNNFLYISDTFNHQIKRINLSNFTVSLVAGSTQGDSVDTLGSNSKFNAPNGLAISSDGRYLYVADTYNHKIKRIDLGTSNFTVSLVAGSTQGDSVDTLGSNSKFNAPNGLAIQSNRLFVCDTNNHKIKRIDLGTTDFTVSLVAGSTQGDRANVPPIVAQFNRPYGICYSNFGLSFGVLFVTDTHNYKIKIIYLDNSNVKEIGTTYGDVDGHATSLKIGRVYSISPAPDGRYMYMYDYDNKKMKMIDTIDTSTTQIKSFSFNNYNTENVNYVLFDGNKCFISSIYTNNLRVYDVNDFNIKKCQLYDISGNQQSGIKINPTLRSTGSSEIYSDTVPLSTPLTSSSFAFNSIQFLNRSIAIYNASDNGTGRTNYISDPPNLISTWGLNTLSFTHLKFENYIYNIITKGAYNLHGYFVDSNNNKIPSPFSGSVDTIVKSTNSFEIGTYTLTTSIACETTCNSDSTCGAYSFDPSLNTCTLFTIGLQSGNVGTSRSIVNLPTLTITGTPTIDVYKNLSLTFTTTDTTSVNLSWSPNSGSLQNISSPFNQKIQGLVNGSDYTFTLTVSNSSGITRSTTFTLTVPKPFVNLIAKVNASGSLTLKADSSILTGGISIVRQNGQISQTYQTYDTTFENVVNGITITKDNFNVKWSSSFVDLVNVLLLSSNELIQTVYSMTQGKTQEIIIDSASQYLNTIRINSTPYGSGLTTSSIKYTGTGQNVIVSDDLGKIFVQDQNVARTLPLPFTGDYDFYNLYIVDQMFNGNMLFYTTFPNYGMYYYSLSYDLIKNGFVWNLPSNSILTPGNTYTLELRGMFLGGDNYSTLNTFTFTVPQSSVSYGSTLSLNNPIPSSVSMRAYKSDDLSVVSDVFTVSGLITPSLINFTISAISTTSITFSGTANLPGFLSTDTINIYNGSTLITTCTRSEFTSGITKSVTLSSGSVTIQAKVANDETIVSESRSATVAVTVTQAIGGTISYLDSPTNKVVLHTFTSSGNFTLTSTLTGVDILIVGGGGGGGGPGNSYIAGGGGGGGVIYLTNITIPKGNSSNVVVVGNGGTGGSNSQGSDGGNSSFDSNYVAYGGGGGGGGTDSNSSYPSTGRPFNGRNGGSGGGEAASVALPGTGVSLQGNSGGSITAIAVTGKFSGAGGGGAGSAGGNVTTIGTGGIKGSGISNSINGTAYVYSCGGGGSAVGATATTTGISIQPSTASNTNGGNGAILRGSGNVPGNNATGYGSGGGGGGVYGSGTPSSARGGNGFQGVVYIKYTLP